MESSTLKPQEEFRRLVRAFGDWRTERRCGAKSQDSHRRTLSLNAYYPYEPIKASEQIRILELYPCSEEGPLVGGLVVVNLNSAPPFEALSHHWGQHVPGGSVQCDDVELTVTPSIAEALRQLRFPNHTRRLWIDSICINQSNLLEKDAQVLQMRNIYQRAMATLIWLGEEDESSKVAFSLIDELFSHAEEIWKLYGKTPSFEQLLEYGFFKSNDGDWSSLGKLGRRGWFTRTWILQEVGLAKRAIVHCGGYSCEWQAVAFVAWTLWHGTAYDYVRAVDLCIAFKTLKVTGGTAEELPLWRLLELTTNHKASDPRDKVFALLGLAIDAKSFSPLVDYNIEVSALYRAVFKHYFLKGQLGLLNYAGNAAWRTEKSVPTWVPDWSCEHNISSMVHSGAWHAPVHLPKYANATAISLDGRVLTMSGFVIDRVKSVRSPLVTQDPLYPFIWKSWRRLAMNATAYPNRTARAEAFEHTITLDCPRAWTESFQDVGNFLQAFSTEVIYSYRVHWTKGQDLAAVMRREAAAGDRRRVEMLQFAETISWTCSSRSFFLTKSGGMGLGPFFLRPGDLLVELERGITPYVVRPAADGHYTFIGEAYLHGWMNKKPVSLEDRRLQTFHIV